MQFWKSDDPPLLCTWPTHYTRESLDEEPETEPWSLWVGSLHEWIQLSVYTSPHYTDDPYKGRSTTGPDQLGNCVLRGTKAAVLAALDAYLLML